MQKLHKLCNIEIIPINFNYEFLPKRRFLVMKTTIRVISV